MGKARRRTSETKEWNWRIWITQVVSCLSIYRQLGRGQEACKTWSTDSNCRHIVQQSWSLPSPWWVLMSSKQNQNKTHHTRAVSYIFDFLFLINFTFVLLPRSVWSFAVSEREDLPKQLSQSFTWASKVEAGKAKVSKSLMVNTEVKVIVPALTQHRANSSSRWSEN